MYSSPYSRIITALLAMALMLSACVPVSEPIVAPAATPQDDTEVKALVQQLTQGDAVARASAVYELGKLGPNAAPYVPEILAIIEDAEPDVRTVAAYALGKIGVASEQTVAVLLNLINDPNEPIRVRYSAIRALGKLGVPGAAGIVILTALLAQDPDDNIRWVAVDALANLGGANDPEVRKALIDALVDPSWYVSNRASEILAALGDEGADLLVNDFKANVNWNRRSAILATLARMPDAAAPRLGAILADEAASIAEPTVLAAAGLSQMDQKGLEQIFAAAQADTPVTEIAVAALPRFGEQALQQLSTIARDTNKKLEVRQGAIKAMGAVAVSPSTVISELLTISQDVQVDRGVRVAALEALGKYGPIAGEAIPVLQELLMKETGEIQAAAITALGRIGPGQPDIIDELVAILGQCDDEAIRAGQALGRMGLLAQDAVPELLQALVCPNPKTQAAAAEALGVIAPRSSSVIDALAKKLASEDPSVAKNAATALGRLGPAALPDVMAALTGATAAGARQRAADALVEMGSVAAPGLVRLLENPTLTPETHALATTALGRIGRPALPFLIQGLREKDLAARQRILNTLYKIGAHAFEGFQWALQDPDLAVDSDQLDAIYGAAYTTNGATVTRSIAVPEALPFLIASLPLTGTIEERREVPKALGFIGPEAVPAVPLLAQAFAESDPAYRCEVAWALLLIGPDDTGAAAPGLAAALADAEPGVLCETNSDIVRMIRNRKPAGYELLLAEILVDPKQNIISPSLQHLLIYALTGLGAKAEAAIPALITTLRAPLSNKSSVRRLAAEALGQVGAAAHPSLRDLLRTDLSVSAVPGLDGALTGRNNDLRRSAAYALLRSNAELDRITMEALRAIAQDEAEDSHLRAMVAAALATHRHPLPGLDAAVNINAPPTQMCPTWEEMMARGGVRSIGFDPYAARCIYTKPRDAPRWQAVFKWLAKTWKSK